MIRVGEEVRHLAGPALLPDGTVRRCLISMDCECITRVSPTPLSQEVSGDEGVFSLPSGCTAVPGLVDMHMHGVGGVDVSDTGEPSEHTWRDLSRRAAEHGATSVVPALVSSSPGTTREFLRRARALPEGPEGARIPGVHLEGPFLAPEKAGAHKSSILRCPDLDEVSQWLESAADELLMVTLAPELPRAEGAINLLQSADVVVAAGHTAAGYQEMMDAFSAGVTHVVHLFNAMSSFHHRRPGAVGAALMHPGITCEIIADGVHVHSKALELATRLKSPDHLCLVTDACPAAGMPPGTYRMGETDLTVTEDCARTPDGALAGSVLTPQEVLQRASSILGWSLSRIVKGLSQVPSEVLGLPAGQIKEGRWADITVLDDRWRVRATVVSGRLVYATVPEGSI